MRIAQQDSASRSQAPLTCQAAKPPRASSAVRLAPGVIISRTGGHTPGHSVVRLSSGGDQLMFAGDAIFPVSFEHPEWHNGFEHDPEEATRVRLRLMKELATTGGMLVATHMPFPSIGHVAADGDLFRWVPATWDY